LVREFYKSNFWDRVRGDDLTNQAIAETIFNFAVNTGVGIASKLAQLIVGTTPDGAIGPKTLERLNICTVEKFLPAYALAKISRYAQICNKDRSQSKFLLGWINRTLHGLK
jgi:lysozyme family protein